MSNDKNIDASKVDTPTISNLEKIDPVWWKPDEDKKPKPPFDFCSDFSDEDLFKLRNQVEGRG